MNDILFHFVYQHQGNWDEVYNSLIRKERVDEKNKHFPKENNFVSILDGEYPYLLKKINKSPFLIFFKGDRELLSRKKISISLNHKSTLNIIEKFNPEKIVFVLRQEQLTPEIYDYFFKRHFRMIIVKSIGIDLKINENYFLEERIIKENLLVSEVPNGFIKKKSDLNLSVRFLVGLSEILLLNNPQKSTITSFEIDYALSENREVIVDGISNYSNQLLNSGAVRFEDSNEIKRYLS